MRLSTLVIPALTMLAACGPDPETERNLEAKAEEMDAAADQATDPAQEQVLENQAEALRETADGEEQADDEGSVTVVKE